MPISSRVISTDQLHLGGLHWPVNDQVMGQQGALMMAAVSHDMHCVMTTFT
jgi:hypothetical protein